MSEDFEAARRDITDEIARLLALELEENPVSYNLNRARPYQGYGRLNLPGNRVVEDRFRELGVYAYLNVETATLDIGSNTGFTTVEAAFMGGLAHGVEPNPLLNRVGQLAAMALGVAEKVRFFTETFEEFESGQKYDLVLSLAAFHTHDGRERSGAPGYFGKIHNLMNEGARLVFESVSYGVENEGRCPELYAFKKPVSEALAVIGEIFTVEKSWRKTRAIDGAQRDYLVARKR